jgi:Na+/H+ antiporter NhaD/arsenite permease-like protein
MRKKHKLNYQFICFLLALLSPLSALASEVINQIDLSSNWVGYSCLLLAIIAYIFVILEEKLHLKKSKPVLIAAGLIWIIIAFSQIGNPNNQAVELAIRHDFLDYSELFFFLLVAMTYINALVERGVFDVLRDWLVSKGFSYRQLFWLTGFLAFFNSQLADNLTTTLIISAVIMAVSDGH